jgi:hypothetical protein
MQTEQTQTPEETQPTPPSLQLADLVLALRVIQLTAQRGAIRADEMAEVGALHDKLIKFLSASGALAPAPKQEENPNG